MQTISDSLMLDLELELNIALRPFRTKPVAKYVTLDKFSADGCSKGPQHTNGPECTGEGRSSFARYFKTGEAFIFSLTSIGGAEAGIYPRLLRLTSRPPQSTNSR